jgi:hypothetical protein
MSSNLNSAGSKPKRYHSVFTESTPIASFGVQYNDNHSRSRSVRTVIDARLMSILSNVFIDATF